MTVTRTRLTSPPDPGVRAPIAAEFEDRQHRDTLKVLAYFAGRHGQWRTLREIVSGTQVPHARLFPVLDYLVASGVLTKDNEHVTRTGTRTPAWTRPIEAPNPSSGGERP